MFPASCLLAGRSASPRRGVRQWPLFVWALRLCSGSLVSARERSPTLPHPRGLPVCMWRRGRSLLGVGPCTSARRCAGRGGKVLGRSRWRWGPPQSKALRIVCCAPGPAEYPMVVARARSPKVAVVVCACPWVGGHRQARWPPGPVGFVPVRAVVASYG